MRIENKNLDIIKKTAKKNLHKSDSIFSLDIADEKEIRQPKNISNMNSLFMVQEFNYDQNAQNKQATYKASKLIEGLEELRLNLVLGNYDIAKSKDKLESLINNFKNNETYQLDPDLVNIIEQIELRVAVEIAKLDYLS